MGKKQQTITLEEAMKMIPERKSSLNISIQGLLGWIFGISIIVGLFALAISFAIWAVKLLIGMIA